MRARTQYTWLTPSQERSTLPLDSLDPELGILLRETKGLVLVLTGAGVSAESGIPTFRGPEGYWTVGSQEYHPQEMATHSAYTAMPDEVWRWYLYRRGVCRSAEPNAAHRAIVELESSRGDDFRLVTQNVDGLHLRAGNSPERTHQIHGNLDYLRCARGCSEKLHPLAAELVHRSKEEELSDDSRAALRCPHCGGPGRPHVLWFDESYDENHFRAESALLAASEAALLILAGTSGATTLPHHITHVAVQRGIPIVDINPQENHLAELARAGEPFFALRSKAGESFPLVAEALS